MSDKTEELKTLKQILIKKHIKLAYIHSSQCSYELVNESLTRPSSGGGIRVWGIGGTELPHVLQNFEYGSDGRSAKQNTHLKQNQKC